MVKIYDFIERKGILKNKSTASTGSFSNETNQEVGELAWVTRKRETYLFGIWSGIAFHEIVSSGHKIQSREPDALPLVDRYYWAPTTRPR
jgi:hypothetical protein